MGKAQLNGAGMVLGAEAPLKKLCCPDSTAGERAGRVSADLTWKRFIAAAFLWKSFGGFFSEGALAAYSIPGNFGPHLHLGRHLLAPSAERSAFWIVLQASGTVTSASSMALGPSQCRSYVFQPIRSRNWKRDTERVLQTAPGHRLTCCRVCHKLYTYFGKGRPCVNILILNSLGHYETIKQVSLAFASTRGAPSGGQELPDIY